MKTFIEQSSTLTASSVVSETLTNFLISIGVGKIEML